MRTMILVLGLVLTFSAMGKNPAPRPRADKLLVSLLSSPELAKFIASSAMPSLIQGEFSSVSAQVDESDPKAIDYQFFFEYTKVGARDVSCNFTATILFDACSGNVGKLSAPMFTDLSCDE